MALPPKTRLGAYELMNPLGSGAMGDVYKARDLKLDRFVAIKVLRPEFASDAERLRRFEGEARSASALNHPCIVHIYDVGQSEKIPFIAMELVEGETFRQKTSSGPLELRRLLELATQMADALASAHEKGIIHRDLKPENLMESREGYVKILDFGLAKLTSPDSDSISPLATQTGAIVGTAGYMSPEQARGEKATHRSDQFSLGLILYEMATGHRAFQGETFAETLVAILRSEPTPPARLNPRVPPELQRLIARCLEKDAQQRYPTTRALARELQLLKERQLTQSSSAELPSTAPITTSSMDTRSWSKKIKWSAAGLLGLAVLLLIFFTARQQQTRESEEIASPVATTRLRLLTSSQGPEERVLGPALSRDGKMFVFVAEKGGRSDLFVGRVAGGARIRLTDDQAQEESPNFSPNGELVAYSRRLSDFAVPEIAIQPILGGPAMTVVQQGSMPTWSPDGKELAFIWTRENYPRALAVIDLDGPSLGRPGEEAPGMARTGPRILYETDGTHPFLYDPTWSPQGDLIALRLSSGGVAGEIWLISTQGSPPRRLTTTSDGVFEHNPSFTADGESILFSSNLTGATNLWRIPVTGGAPIAVTSGSGPDVEPSHAANGSVAFLNSTWRHSLQLYDLKRREKHFLLHHSSFLWAPTFSPDGSQVIFSRAEADGSWQLWTLEAPNTEATTAPSAPLDLSTAGRRLTQLRAGALYPQFAKSEGSLIFSTWESPRTIFRLPRDGSPPSSLLPDGVSGAFGDLSPDGRVLAYCRQIDGDERIFMVDLEQGDHWPLVDVSSSLPRWSPDGKWIAFSPDRSWDRGVFVVAADGREPRRLTQEGGWPVWWPDGSKIAYLTATQDGSQALRSVPLAGGPSSPLEGLTFGSTNHPFDVSPDGRWIVSSDSVPLSDEIWLVEAESPAP